MRCVCVFVCVVLFQFFIPRFSFQFFSIHLRYIFKIRTKSCILMLNSKWHAHFTFIHSLGRSILFLSIHVNRAKIRRSLDPFKRCQNSGWKTMVQCSKGYVQFRMCVSVRSRMPKLRVLLPFQMVTTVRFARMIASHTHAMKKVKEKVKNTFKGSQIGSCEWEQKRKRAREWLIWS